jgi:hypothetical protein
MKHFNYYFIIMALAFVGFTSCSDDDGPTLNAPTPPTMSVTVNPDNVDYTPGTEIVYTIVAAATEGQLFSLEVSASEDSEYFSGLDSYFYNSNETVTFTYVVPFNKVNVNIEFKVTAVNPDDIGLISSASENKTFGVAKTFTEYKDIKLNISNFNDLKTVLRLDTGETWSIDETAPLSGDDKLALDIYPYFKNTTIYFSNLLQGLIGNPVTNAWEGQYIENKENIADKLEGFSTDHDYDYNDTGSLLPGDIYVGGANYVIIQMDTAVGTVIAFDNANTSRAYDTDGDGVDDGTRPRINPDSAGLIIIKELVTGTLDETTGLYDSGYIVIDLKVGNK